MYKRLIRNDIIQSKLITITTILFISAAAMLVSLAAILIFHLSGALDNLMNKAETPHFMQMHAGEIYAEEISSFAIQHDNVEKYQIVPFLGIDNSNIFLGENTLTNSVQENGLSMQNEKFDYLLDLEGEIFHVNDGEIYTPVAYMDMTNIGDKAIIYGKEFIVAGFFRDSTMNSLLAASKRFLVSSNDFEEMKSFGTIEYLIEFRLKDYGKIGEFEADYVSSQLPANGPAVTYNLFKTMNALSDGIMIGLIILVSILVIVIALMCIRFTLLAKIEDDYREIGVLKAIDIRIADIKKIYLAKYVIIAACGSIIGFILSLLCQDILLEKIRLYMGENENSTFSFTLGVVGILFVFISIIIYISILLNRLKKVSAQEAIRFGHSQEKKISAKYFTLHKNNRLSTNIFLGIKDVLTRKKTFFNDVYRYFVFFLYHRCPTKLVSHHFI